MRPCSSVEPAFCSLLSALSLSCYSSFLSQNFVYCATLASKSSPLLFHEDVVKEKPSAL